MERTLGKQVRPVSYGRACNRCKSYFVTTNQNDYVCPWCMKVETGAKIAELYEVPERLGSPQSEASLS